MKYSNIDLSDPVNKNSSLNRGLISWWLVLPVLRGYPTFHDLMRRFNATLDLGGLFTSPVGRKGGWGSLACDGNNAISSTSLTSQLLDFSVSAWFYSNVNENLTRRIVDKQFDSGFWLGHDTTANSKYGGGILEGSDPYGHFLTFSENTWHHILMTRKGTTKTIYGNGGVLSVIATVSASAISTAAFKIGFTTGASWSGYLDDIRIWDRALNASEVGEVFYDSKKGYQNTLNRKRGSVFFFSNIPFSQSYRIPASYGVEEDDERFGVFQEPIAYGGNTSTAFSSDFALDIEYLLDILTEADLDISFLEGLRTTGPLSIAYGGEAGTTIAKDFDLSIETILDIFSDLDFDAGLLGSIRTTGPMSVENLLDYFTDLDAGIGFLQPTAPLNTFSIVSAGTTGTTLSSDHIFSIEHLLDVESDIDLDIGTLGAINTTGPMAIAHMQGITRNPALSVEYLMDILTDVDLDISFLAGLLGTGPLSIVYGGSAGTAIAQDFQLSIEYLLDVVTDLGLDFDPLSYFNSVGPLGVATLGTVKPNNQLSVENLLDYFTEIDTHLGLLGQINPAGPLSIVYGGSAGTSIAKDFVLSIEYILDIFSDLDFDADLLTSVRGTGPLSVVYGGQAGTAVSKDSIFSIEHLLDVESDIDIDIGTFGTITRTTGPFSIEILAGANASRAVSVENLLDIVTETDLDISFLEGLRTTGPLSIAYGGSVTGTPFAKDSEFSVEYLLDVVTDLGLDFDPLSYFNTTGPLSVATLGGMKSNNELSIENLLEYVTEIDAALGFLGIVNQTGPLSIVYGGTTGTGLFRNFDFSVDNLAAYIKSGATNVDFLSRLLSSITISAEFLRKLQADSTLDNDSLLSATRSTTASVAYLMGILSRHVNSIVAGGTAGTEIGKAFILDIANTAGLIGNRAIDYEFRTRLIGGNDFDIESLRLLKTNNTLSETWLSGFIKRGVISAQFVLGMLNSISSSIEFKGRISKNADLSAAYLRNVNTGAVISLANLLSVVGSQTSSTEFRGTYNNIPVINIEHIGRASSAGQLSVEQLRSLVRTITDAGLSIIGDGGIKQGNTASIEYDGIIFTVTPTEIWVISNGTHTWTLGEDNVWTLTK